MSINNQMYVLFRDMKKGYDEGNMDIVEQCARCWMQIAEDNPFEYDTPEYDLFFNMQKSYAIWSKGAIDQKINRRRMIQYAKQLCALDAKQPYVFDKIADEEEKRIKREAIQQEQEAKRKKEELRRSEEEKKRAESLKKNDVRYVMLEMTKAYNENDNENFRQNAIHFSEILNENPFPEGTEEYYKTEEIKDACEKHNVRRIIVLAQQLCDTINNVQIEPKKVVLETPKTILGVPEEKKSWIKFLHPRKKEGVKNDGK